MLVFGLLLAAAPPSSIADAAGATRPAGRVAWQPVEVPLSRPADGPLWAIVLGPSGSGAGSLFPYAEVESVGPRRARVRVPAAAIRPGRAELTATVVVARLGEERALGLSELRVVFDVVPASPTASDVKRQAEAYGAWLDLAGWKGDQALAVPDRPTTGSDRATAAAYLASARAAVEALAAREGLRAAGLGPPEVAGPALRALARPLKSGRPEPLERSVAAAIAEAEVALSEVRLERVKRLADEIRGSARATPLELARLLVLEAAIAAARGDDPSLLLGQARAVNPQVSVHLQVPFLAAALASVAPREGALGVGRLRAAQIRLDGGLGLRVEVGIDSDGLGVVTAVRADRYGPGGARIESRTARRDPTDRAISVDFPGATAADTGPIEVHLLERSGAAVRTARVEGPVEVREEPGPHIPWWVFVLGGAVVVAGAAVGGALLLDPGEPRRAVGPVTIEF